MYKYKLIDQEIVQQRVDQYKSQLARFLNGQLAEEEFRPLRLQNGLYIQRHAPMLRVAIPYGMLSGHQLRTLADIADQYDHGYAHFTTRQNLQYNWIKLENTGHVLQELAQVEMHAIQTSGNCIRNITTDEFAGVAKDEILDPRPFCEILRQWSTLHPEFAGLPRKFKIAVNASHEDRSVTFAHDIGLYLYLNDQKEVRVRVLVGGGLGRTPIIGTIIKENLHWQDIMSYCEAILRVYNRYGRRDNLYKARIKILLKALGPEAFTQKVEAEFAHLVNGPATLTQAELDRVAGHFTAPEYEHLHEVNWLEPEANHPIAFQKWLSRNTRQHKVSGYISVILSLKPNGVAPGDITSEQMRLTAQLADQYAFGELRISHEQNVILADVPQKDLFDIWTALKDNGMATPNIGLLTDMITCPGGDFCSLANAKSIPIANAIQDRFNDLDYLADLGEIQLNISGCMNSCGHHHVAHIGILGVDKDGKEWYQISLGGSDATHLGGYKAQIGKIIGPSFAADTVVDAIETIVNTFVALRIEGELFIDTVQRLGITPFKEAVYPAKAKSLSNSSHVPAS